MRASSSSSPDKRNTSHTGSLFSWMFLDVDNTSAQLAEFGNPTLGEMMRGFFFEVILMNRPDLFLIFPKVELDESTQRCVIKPHKKNEVKNKLKLPKGNVGVSHYMPNMGQGATPNYPTNPAFQNPAQIGPMAMPGQGMPGMLPHQGPSHLQMQNFPSMQNMNTGPMIPTQEPAHYMTDGQDPSWFRSVLLKAGSPAKTTPFNTGQADKGRGDGSKWRGGESTRDLYNDYNDRPDFDFSQDGKYVRKDTNTGEWGVQSFGFSKGWQVDDYYHLKKWKWEDVEGQWDK